MEKREEERRGEERGKWRIVEEEGEREERVQLNRVKWSNGEKSGVIIKNKKVSQEDENYTDE